MYSAERGGENGVYVGRETAAAAVVWAAAKLSSDVCLGYLAMLLLLSWWSPIAAAAIATVVGFRYSGNCCCCCKLARASNAGGHSLTFSNLQAL